MTDETELYSFADLHHIARLEALQRFKLGMIAGSNRGTPRKPMIVIAAKGKRDFWIQFHDMPGFRTCDVCPHS